MPLLEHLALLKSTIRNLMDKLAPKPASTTISTQLKYVVIVCGWLLASLALSYPRLTSPDFGLQGDVPLHYHLARSFARSLTEGEWLPRWAGLLDGGRGDAAFTFYPPLYYWLSGGLSTLSGLELLTALKCISFLGFVLAGVNAYWLARAFADDSQNKHSVPPSMLGALIGLLYLVLPSYLFISLHRGFLPNAFALSLIPLPILGAHRVLMGQRRIPSFLLFALSFSAIILTHVITAYLCGLTIGLMALCYLPRAGWRGLARLCGGGLLALALTAFFWGPQMIEMKWVQIGLQVVQQDYRNYFLFAQASDVNHYRQGWADVNYIGSLLVVAQVALALTLGLFSWRNLSRARYASLAWFSLLLALAGLFISLPASNILWRYLPGLKFIQFPWRFQPFVALSAVMLAAIASATWKEMGRGVKMLCSAALTWMLLVNLVLTIMIALPKGQEASRAQIMALLSQHDAPPFTADEARQPRLAFLPYTPNQIFFRPLGADTRLYPPVDHVGGLTIITGRGQIKSQQLRIAHREFQLENVEPIRARIETYHYPNWIARLDGRETKIETEPNTGLMLIDVPAGAHTLDLDFKTVNAGSRSAGVVSLAAWLLLMSWLVGRKIWPRFSRSNAAQSG